MYKYILPLLLINCTKNINNIQNETSTSKSIDSNSLDSGVDVSLTCEVKEKSCENKDSICGPSMKLIEGEFCPNLIENCLLKDKDDKRCLEFASPSKCDGKTVRMKFCMDTYEYPNKKGEKPKVFTTWLEAKETCKQEGKRLCKQNEWSQACRGPENKPYPYGYVRDSSKCNIDLAWTKPNEQALANPLTRADELARLDHFKESGAMECVSDYGVYDLTGNADEWVVGPSSHPSNLMGGHPFKVRNRCSNAVTDGHGETFAYYVTSFRCCKDIQ